MTYKQIVKCWPSINQLAYDLGEKPDTVRKWQDRNSIPPEKWGKVMKAARKRGYKVSGEILMRALSKRWVK